MINSMHLPERIFERKVPVQTKTLDYVFLTTATLPWRTGTSINPLLRASQFKKLGHKVALAIPWTNEKDQLLLYNEVLFNSQEEQVGWLKKSIVQMGLDCPDEIIFYKSRYYNYFKSIFAEEDLSKVIPPCKHLILEEPDHLFMLENKVPNFKAEQRVGILHTNYEYYYDQANDFFIKGFMNNLTNVIIDSTDKCLALSKVVTTNPGRTFIDILPVNGVQDVFFKEASVPKSNELSVLFIGKLIWEKGFKDLIEIAVETNIKIDIYGSGPNKSEIMEAANKVGAKLHFMGSTNNVAEVLQHYDLFINPSESEVYCTTNCEALATGKYLIIPDHISNQGFKGFEKAIFYKKIDDAVQMIESLKGQKKMNSDRFYKKPKFIEKLSVEYTSQKLIDYCEENPKDERSEKINTFQTKLVKQSFRLLAILVLFFQDIPKDIKKFLRFTLIGTPVLLINFFGVYLFESILQTSTLISILGINELNTIGAFFLHHYITFKNEKEQVNPMKAFAHFHYSSIICMAIFTLSTYLMASLNISLYLATFLGMCLTNVASYIYTSKIIYKPVTKQLTF